jgi:hypothetical protein
MDEIKNPFGENFVESVAGAFAKWTEVGQTIKGIVTDIYERENTLKDGEMQTIVVVQQEDGSEIQVALKDSSMKGACKNLLKGQHIGFFYAQDIPSKVKGHQAFKNVKVYIGQLDPEFKGQGDVTDEEIAF